MLTDADLSGRRAIVTGAASAIGAETARAWAGAGAEIALAVRNPAAAQTTARDISTGNTNIHIVPLELADQDSVAPFVAAWNSSRTRPGQQRRHHGRAAHPGSPTFQQ